MVRNTFKGKRGYEFTPSQCWENFSSHCEKIMLQNIWWQASSFLKCQKKRSGICKIQENAWQSELAAPSPKTPILSAFQALGFSSSGIACFCP